MPLFQVVILEKPKPSEAKHGALEKLILGPVSVVASDDQAAAYSVVMDNPNLKINRGRMQVIARPFA